MFTLAFLSRNVTRGECNSMQEKLQISSLKTSSGLCQRQLRLSVPYTVFLLLPIRLKLKFWCKLKITAVACFPLVGCISPPIDIVHNAPHDTYYGLQALPRQRSQQNNAIRQGFIKESAQKWLSFLAIWLQNRKIIVMLYTRVLIWKWWMNKDVGSHQ